ncbi:MAG: IS4 family transposase [bacterium]|nr:IS4 family transposase [bacterium]
MGEREKDEYECDAGWASVELGSCDFGDTRRNRRVLKVAEDLSKRPLVPINHASEDWAATKAAYRIFSNERVSRSELLSAHLEQTRSRVRDEEVVLAIQDTTYLNYGNHEKCSGLGYCGNKELKGITMHSTLVVTPSGLPLGLATQHQHTRLEPGCSATKKNYRSIPIEEKESFRWIKALRETVKVCGSAKQVVTVCDRECDIYEFLMEADNLATHYVVRSSSPRLVEEEDAHNIIQAVESREIAGAHEVLIPSREGVKGRKAHLEIRFAEVTLRPPQHLKGDGYRPIRVWVVLANENNPPEGTPGLRWLLLTNVEVKTFEAALERIDWYKARWHIEIFHKVLKSGCKVEDCRLETIRGLMLYLTMFSIIAWRIYWFTHISRVAPDASPRTILAKSEFDALSMLAGRKKHQKAEIKSVKKAVIEIAKLGGFLARRHDGHPGPTVIWRGWQRLSDATEIYETMQLQTCG